MNAAERCKQMNWTVGTVIQYKEDPPITITAVGDQHVLCSRAGRELPYADFCPHGWHLYVEPEERVTRDQVEAARDAYISAQAEYDACCNVDRAKANRRTTCAREYIELSIKFHEQGNKWP